MAAGVCRPRRRSGRGRRPARHAAARQPRQCRAGGARRPRPPPTRPRIVPPRTTSRRQARSRGRTRLDVEAVWAYDARPGWCRRRRPGVRTGPRLRARPRGREAPADAAGGRRRPPRAGRGGCAPPCGLHAALLGRPGAGRPRRGLGPADVNADHRGADRGARARAGVDRSGGRTRERGAHRAAGPDEVQHGRSGPRGRGGRVLRHRHHRPRAREGLPVGHAGPRRRARAPAGPGGEGRQPPAAPARAAGHRAADDVQRRGQPPHGRGQRAARLRPGRAARGVPEAPRRRRGGAPPAAGRRTCLPVGPRPIPSRRREGSVGRATSWTWWRPSRARGWWSSTRRRARR